MFSVRNRANDVGHVFQKTSDIDSEIIITDALRGEYNVYIVPDDTRDLKEQLYAYDSELIDLAGKVYTVMTGGFNLSTEILKSNNKESIQ